MAGAGTAILVVGAGTGSPVEVSDCKRVREVSACAVGGILGHKLATSISFKDRETFL